LNPILGVPVLLVMLAVKNNDDVVPPTPKANCCDADIILM